MKSLHVSRFVDHISHWSAARSASGVLFLALVVSGPAALGLSGQEAPPDTDARVYGIATAGSPDRLEADIRTLAGFGTRNTLSDTLSDSRGIGAARRWIKAEMDRISADCGGCMEVFYTEKLFTPEMTRRIPEPVNVVNVVGVIRGSRFPDRYVIMSGDIDSRNSSGSDEEGDAPGANDNASGMAGVLEAARILTRFYEDLRGEDYLTFGAGLILGGTSVSHDPEFDRGEAFGKTNVIARSKATKRSHEIASPRSHV